MRGVEQLDLAARGAEDFLLEAAKTHLDARFAELRLDRINLRLNGCDIAFEFAPQVGDVVFGRHVLDDVLQHLADFVERRFFCHCGKYSTRVLVTCG
jgi:hypothetical protein